MDNEEIQRHNKPFLKAFDWLANLLGLKQKDMAIAMGDTSQHISAFRRGTKRVSALTKNRLIKLSIDKKVEINIDYLDGISNYMLVGNIPREEKIEAINKRNNPDYEQLRKDRNNVIDKNEEINVVINSFQQEIDRLNDKLKEKENKLNDNEERIEELKDHIKTLKIQLSEKDKEINNLSAKLARYESEEILKDFTFTQHGVAESHNDNQNV